MNNILAQNSSIKYNILLIELILCIYACTFFFLYLRGKEKRKYERKKKSRWLSTSSLCSAVSFFVRLRRISYARQSLRLTLALSNAEHCLRGKCKLAQRDIYKLVVQPEFARLKSAGLPATSIWSERPKGVGNQRFFFFFGCVSFSFARKKRKRNAQIKI